MKTCGKRSPAGKKQPEQLLFADFNGLEDDFSKKVDFYQHEQHWTNRMILGDSLLVMTSLAEKEGLKGKVQCIYIDPPYGIKFGSNWQVSTRKRDVRDGRAEDTTRQPEQVRAFRDTWKLGIHSYLAYLRDRLVVARELLTETGSIFVQIGDENVHLVRGILDETFGSENWCSLITFTKTSSASSEILGGTADYLLWYAKSRENVKYRQLYFGKQVGGNGTSGYTWVELSDGTRRRLQAEESDAAVDGRILTLDNLTSQRPPGDFPVNFQGRTIRPNRGYWKNRGRRDEETCSMPAESSSSEIHCVTFATWTTSPFILSITSGLTRVLPASRRTRSTLSRRAQKSWSGVF